MIINIIISNKYYINKIIKLIKKEGNKNNSNDKKNRKIMF